MTNLNNTMVSQRRKQSIFMNNNYSMAHSLSKRKTNRLLSDAGSDSTSTNKYLKCLNRKFTIVRDDLHKYS